MIPKTVSRALCAACFLASAPLSWAAAAPAPPAAPYVHSHTGSHSGTAFVLPPGLPPVAEEVHLFDYDAHAPLDVQEVGVKKQDGVEVHDISYASPKGGRVTAYLVLPPGKGRFAGVLLMHGAPGDRNRLLPRALLLAKEGAVCLLINAPFARENGAGEPMTFSPGDRDQQIQLIVDLERGVDLLSARPDVDPARLGYIGQSYGAAMGSLLAGVEKRIKAYVIAVGDGGLVSHLSGMGSTMPGDKWKRWVDAMAPIEPIRFVGRAAPAALFFQSGSHDQLVAAEEAKSLQAAASEPKKIKWYDADHFLNDEAVHDQIEWLRGQLHLNPPEKAAR